MERSHFVPLGQCQPNASVPPHRRLLADVDRPPGAAANRSDQDRRVRHHPPAADQGPARVIETATRIRIAFASACDAALFRHVALTLREASP